MNVVNLVLGIIGGYALGTMPSAIVVASEPFTARRADWMKVERNAMMVIDETMTITFHHVEMDVEKLDFETIAPEIG